MPGKLTAMTDKPSKPQATAIIAARVEPQLKRTLEAMAHLSDQTVNDVVIIALNSYIDSLSKEYKAKIQRAAQDVGTLKLKP